MNKKQKLLTVIMAAILLLFIGSSCVQDLMTPTYVDKDAAAWANVPSKLFPWMPWASLWDAKRVGLAIDFELKKKMVEAGYYKNITNLSVIAGEEIKAVIFKPDGAIPLLMSGFGFGTIGTVLGGAYKQRPKDKKRIEELEAKNGGK